MTTTKLFGSKEDLDRLLQIVQSEGYTLYGPTIQQDVIVLDQIYSITDLPIGWMDEQKKGYYRLKKRADEALFGYNLGPHSWKKYLFPSKEKLFSAQKQSNGLVILQESEPPIKKMAFLAVRACEIEAILIQDRVFINKTAVYSQYKQRRDNLLIIAVNCTRSVSTCFCTTMECGPKVTNNFDIAITEVLNDKEHFFIFEIGSEKGKNLCNSINLSVADLLKVNNAEELVQQNALEMEKKIDTESLADTLMSSYDCKHWDNVAKRCINCANCTMVCPTCFCSHTEESVSLDGENIDRWQTWDSCFNLSHSYVHGGNIRQSASSRYRQWLVHKFGTWWKQFGISGCTGCGRCITWCPVGIDVTEEIKHIQTEVHEDNSRNS